MHATPLIALAFALATTAAGPGAGDYARKLDAGSLDQAAFDAECYGDKKSIKREGDGLRVILGQGAEETGWKAPQQLRFGGNFTIAAEFIARDLPKPGLEDGVAVGLAIAFQSIDQPDATFIRVIEPNGSAVYRTIEKAAGGDAMQQQMMMMQQRVMIMNGMGMVMMGGMGQPNVKPGPAARKTFPASGDAFRLELKREGQTLRFLVSDAKSDEPRYLGQATLQPMDVVGVKLFVVNRSGAGAADVVLKSLTIRADRVSGLGTTVRTVFDQVVYGEPTAIEGGKLVIGGPPATPGGIPAPAPTVMNMAGAATTVRVAQGRRVVAPAGAVVMAAMPVQVAQVQVAPAAAAPIVPPAAAAGSPALAGQAPAAADGSLPADVFAAPVPAEPPRPKAVIPLDEVEGIRFEREAAFAARYVGQPNVDLTQGAPAAAQPGAPAPAEPPKKPEPGDDVAAPPPGTTIVKPAPKVEAKKNGIRDIQLALSGLRPAKIQQIMVNCQTDQGATAWQLDAAGSPSWPLILRRTGTDASADLFLEPPPGDCHQKNFTVNVNYEDGQAASANFQADGHSDAKLAFDDKATVAEAPEAWVFLEGDDKVVGKFEGLADDKLRLTTAWKDVLEIPISRIAGVHVSLQERKETPESFARRLKARGTEDLLLARAKNGEVVPIAGVLEGVEGGRLKFLYQGKSRSLPLQQVEGVVLAARRVEPAAELISTFLLPGGVAVPGRWKAIEATVWKVEAPWGQELKLPAAEIQQVRFRNGKMTYLSDLEPSRVEETPFFGRKSPWRRDANLSGGKIKLDGRPYDRGVAVHSRCILTYDLEGRYETFEALLGFDDEARGRGRVDCRVLADDKELYGNPDLRADAPPVPLKLSVAGATQLKLVVDFGADQDAGDRVVWADARLFRVAPPATAATAVEPER